MAKLLATLLMAALALPLNGGSVSAQDSEAPAAPTAAAPPPAAFQDATPFLQGAVDGFVRPAYRAFRDRAQGMADSMRNLCEKPSSEALEAARDTFRKTVRAWGQAEIIRFGPITESNRLDRILFFPDRKGTGLRQIQQALAQKDESVATAETLAQKSVAMQGLGALEYLVWGDGSDELAGTDGAFRCRFGRAAAENVAGMARAVDAAWTDPKGFTAQFTNPSPLNPLYRTGSEALGELLGVFIEGLERTRDVRIKGFLGDNPESDKPKQALFWRSGMTLAVIGSNLAAFSSLWEASGLLAALPRDQRWVGDSVRFEFANANKAAADLDRPVGDTLAEPRLRSRLSYLSLVTSSLSEILGVRLSGVLGLSAGFSSLDGD